MLRFSRLLGARYVGAVPSFAFTFREAMKPRGQAKTWKVLLSNCAQSLLAGLAAFGFCAILIWVTTLDIIDPSGDTVSPSEVTSRVQIFPIW